MNTNMKVILIFKINKLGNAGNIVDVKPGYARNFLIPQEKAVIANKENIAIFNQKQLQMKKLLEEKLIEAKRRAEKLELIGTVNIYCKTGRDEGKIFGSVNRRDIVSALNKLDLSVHKNEIKLLDEPLRKLGKHQVIFQPNNKLYVKFLVNIISKH